MMVATFFCAPLAALSTVNALIVKKIK